MFVNAKMFYGVTNEWELFEVIEDSKPYKEYAAYADIDGWRGIMSYINVFFNDMENNGFRTILSDPFLRDHCILRYEGNGYTEVISKDTQEGFPCLGNCDIEELSKVEKKVIQHLVEGVTEIPDDIKDGDGELRWDVYEEFMDNMAIVEYIDPNRIIKPLGMTVTQLRYTDITRGELLRAVNWEMENKNDFLNIENWI